MKIYGLGGLGSDERIFNFLELDYPIEHIDWIPPFQKESIRSYATRLANNIDTTHEFALMGISFGGMMAVELNKIIKPYKTFIISSAARKQELPGILKSSAFSFIHLLIPPDHFDPPPIVTNWLFSVHKEEHKKVLSRIIKNTDKSFMRWAVKEICRWDNQYLPDNLIRIHGNKDRLLPSSTKEAYYFVDGGHAVVMQKPNEISAIINAELKK
ncbi:MAG: alpha/beta hydrolase [Candidatus Cyclobacteriaceae bacterium M2_1C_046]